MNTVVLPGQWLSASLCKVVRLLRNSGSRAGRLLDGAMTTLYGPPPPPRSGGQCDDDVETLLMVALICATHI
jgi:hypothetical protein